MTAARAAVTATLALGLALGLTSCAPQDLPESSPQGTGSSDGAPLENKVNTLQLPDSSFIYDATISSLEKADTFVDGQTVQVIGEVVGDRILSEKNSEYCWITLEAVDTTYAEIGVYMTLAASDLIDTYGRYGKRGTTLQVRGVFNLACKDHEGVSDLHASHVAVVRKGMDNKPPFNMSQVVPGLLLSLVGAGLVYAFRRLREQQM